ncbi:hypothetical protein GGX14DRAFT_406308 [Mycena pura]|uniref:Uncharacterized protein n=1 Tax=Mycena pura TaxID=153505 RepID=A0AAD6UQK5_9AGAR|nr:hypothetical protein GGX14DRAFT_406308 [Mycena pura]
MTADQAAMTRICDVRAGTVNVPVTHTKFSVEKGIRTNHKYYQRSQASFPVLSVGIGVQTEKYPWQVPVTCDLARRQANLFSGLHVDFDRTWEATANIVATCPAILPPSRPLPATRRPRARPLPAACLLLPGQGRDRRWAAAGRRRAGGGERAASQVAGGSGAGQAGQAAREQRAGGEREGGDRHYGLIILKQFYLRARNSEFDSGVTLSK